MTKASYKLGEYGECERLSHPSFAIFWQVPKAAYGLVLSWYSMMSFLLNFSGLFPSRALLKLSNLTSPNWVFPSSKFPKLIMYYPRIFNLIHNILLFRLKLCLEVEGEGYQGSQYTFFKWIFSRPKLFLIHFIKPKTYAIIFMSLSWSMTLFVSHF